MRLPVSDKALLMLLLPLSLSWQPLLFGQNNTAKIKPPAKMRLCIAAGCNNLTLAGDHYDGTVDGQSAVVARYWVVDWTPKHVQLTGKTVTAVADGYPSEGTFTGQIAADGVSVENARDDWNVGPSRKGSIPFTLTWGQPPASVATSTTLTKAPPKEMRLCVTAGCNNLTLAGDHYDGTVDDQSAVVTRYQVVEWSQKHIELIGKTIALVADGYPAEGTFTGQIASNGVSIENARDDWHVGPSKKGSMAFTLSWGSHPPGPGLTDPGAICRSKEIRDAMQFLEYRQANDLGGQLLTMAACAMAGICPDTSPGRNLPTILGSHPSTDGVGLTKNDPGSFLCQALFARGDVHLAVGKNGDLASELTVDEMEQVLKKFPNFEENYKVRPIEKGRYRLILVPGLGAISQRYSTDFYP